MSVSVALRPSADKGNALGIGSDGGLMGAPLPAGQFASNLNTVDNSQSGGASGTTYYYPMPAAATAAGTVTGTPVAQQLVLTRNALITAVYGNVTNNTSTAAVYGALYLPDPTTRYPGTKVCDLFVMSAAVNGVVSGSMIDTTTVLTGNTPYWLLTWYAATTLMPSMTLRSASAYQQSRLNTVSSATVNSVGVTGTAAWSASTTGPASATTAFPVTAAPSATAPLFYFGVRNA